jgi:hypothetical protein
MIETLPKCQLVGKSKRMNCRAHPGVQRPSSPTAQEPKRSSTPAATRISAKQPCCQELPRGHHLLFAPESLLVRGPRAMTMTRRKGES